MNSVTAVDAFETTPHGRVAVRWYRPAGTDSGSPTQATMVWLHGGGFFKGSLDQPESHDVALALAGRGMTVVAVDYGLVPVPGLRWASRWGMRSRVEFPVAHDQVLAVFRSVRATSPHSVLLGGASAWACLAATAALRAADDGIAPDGVVLAYGFFHSRHPRSAEIRSRVRGRRRYTHAWWALDAANRNYARSPDALADRRAFPGGHDLRGFPTALVINAERDAMRASGDRFAAELSAAGTDVDHHVLPGTSHAFLNQPRLAAFSETIDAITAWSRSR